MINSEPLVSIIMPVYNTPIPFLERSIESILLQSYENIEFLIVNDGSDDDITNFLKSFSLSDQRIRLLYNNSNKGLVYSLNKGLSESNGKYIARMDSDDISARDRLEIQLQYMEKNSEIGVCGAWMETIGGSKKQLYKLPCSHDELLITSFFSTPIWHPTAFIRKSILDKYNLKYDSNFLNCEDFKFWCDFIKFSRLANIPKSLLYYRIHDGQISRKRHFSIGYIYLQNLISFLGREPEHEEIELHLNLFQVKPFSCFSQFQKVKGWCSFLKEHNTEKKYFKEELLFESNLNFTLGEANKRRLENYLALQGEYNLKVFGYVVEESIKGVFPHRSIIFYFKFLIKIILRKKYKGSL